jgi:hypothetical protein
MNGYLMQEGEWIPGEDLFLESFSPENRFGAVFEDDGEAAYFYAVEKDKEGAGVRILDALHIHESDKEGAEADEKVRGVNAEAGEPGENGTDAQKPSRVQIVWSRDWMKCALVIDRLCHALFDFEAHGGYNINEFPPPNEIWTQGDRKLTDELMRRLF